MKKRIAQLAALIVAALALAVAAPSLAFAKHGADDPVKHQKADKGAKKGKGHGKDDPPGHEHPVPHP